LTVSEASVSAAGAAPAIASVTIREGVSDGDHSASHQGVAAVGAARPGIAFVTIRDV
jgi:hypothetical protein